MKRSSLSFVLPNDGKRAIIRARDDHYLEPFPILDLAGCRALHLDGHQGDAALFYAKACRAKGILTSLDGGGLRGNIEELFSFIDIAIVAERLCEQMALSPKDMLDYLKAKGCKIGGMTMGERGMLWYDEKGTISTLPALPVSRARSSIRRARAMSFTAPMSPLILRRPNGALPRISNSPALPRPIKSSISAMKRACRRWPISRRLRRMSVWSERPPRFRHDA